ncbi:peptidoglycan D,D-transpeptidase FtsI family protein [Agromyces aerolatus]|uniref:peptidoglycan D,D-transpeptidase FtsI family protein n=1 Tax=Agromyces sp. LY-1074 TaxID=3074080 RepID=UPI002863D2CB|nr:MULTISPECIES: penicillin-binding protein 2 [unclassified Agromyces]MDR5700774.1 penicillin-binding protein 2 [Agromyces sp. LY-1074]MDR5707295.1 penicillin-binding protein 2 [Agromyces sp. LY-1358]
MRRIIASGVVLVVVVGVFVTRLVDIQVVRADEYNEAAQDVRSSSETVYGPRGDLVDANGVVLADTVMRYDIAISPKQARAGGSFERDVPDPDDPAETVETEVTTEQAATELGAALGLAGDHVLGIIDEYLAADPDSDFAYVSKLVDTETYEKVRALGIPWVYPKENPSRRYPNGAVAGNLVGFVDPDGNPVAGLELAQDACLAGEDGETTHLRSLRDWVTIPGSEHVVKEAREGGTLQLTIDSDLQYSVQRTAEAQVEATGADWATVTVMEAKTGRLLAVADVPTVDPNTPSAIDGENRGSRAFTAPFEPGSTFKALTAASVIDAGQGDPTSQIVAPYRITPGNADINDSYLHGDDRLTLTGVMIESSNTGMSLFGERVSDEQRYQDMLDFGLGTQTEVGFPAEAAGDLHGGPAAWAEDDQTKYATMFGQGLTTTAIQIASAYQTIANGGVRMPVTLVDGCAAPDGSVTGKPSTEGKAVISEQAAQQTSQMLERVYAEGWLAKQWEIPGYRVAAKTGTAQVPDGEGGYQAGYLVSVSGFAPADDPQFVVSVSIMNPVKMNSSAASAPVFRDVMSQVLKKYRTVPSGAPAPELPATW